MKFNTKTIHAGQQPDPSSGAIMPPVYQTSTYVQESPNVHKGYDYARVGNPTRTALEKSIAGLENADECAAFASGCAAMDALLKILRPGDEVISTNDLYGGTYRLFREVFEPYNITFHFTDLSNPEEFESLLNENTRMVWIETPTNPLLRLIDIKKLSERAHEYNSGIMVVVDNTFASPYLQQPLELGADAVVHSTTKYLGGHSDVIGGAVATSDEKIAEHLRFQAKTSGAVPGPMDCYLTLRGIKTLHLRVERSQANAEHLADYLADHHKVGEVKFPGFADHPQHELMKRQMRGPGAMVSFTLKSDSLDEAQRFMTLTRYFSLAESLGGVESLISHPATMTHGSIPREVRIKAGLKDSLIRLSVGVEDIQDLKEDLEQALHQLG